MMLQKHYFSRVVQMRARHPEGVAYTCTATMYVNDKGSSVYRWVPLTILYALLLFHCRLDIVCRFHCHIMNFDNRLFEFIGSQKSQTFVNLFGIC